MLRALIHKLPESSPPALRRLSTPGATDDPAAPVVPPGTTPLHAASPGTKTLASSRLASRGRAIWLAVLGVVALTGATACSTPRLLEEEQAKALARNPSAFEPEIRSDSGSDRAPRIQPGDEITVLVFGYEEFDTQGVVSSDGTLVMPLVGELQVAGLTRSGFEGRVRQALREFIREEIVLTVSIRNTSRDMVSVLGSVRDPSNYPVIGQASLFEVLSMAGGTLEDADLRNIRIYRQHSPLVQSQVDLTWHLEQGQIDSSPLRIQPGDIVLVPRKDNMVRELSFFLRDVVLLFGLFNAFR